MPSRLALASLVTLAGLIGCSGCAAPVPTAEAPPVVEPESLGAAQFPRARLAEDGVFYEEGEASRDGTGRFYMGREIAQARNDEVAERAGIVFGIRFNERNGGFRKQSLQKPGGRGTAEASANDDETCPDLRMGCQR